MAREPRHIQNAFNAGELSPRLHSRFDLKKYKHGCKTLENFIPMVYGGVTRRPGTRFVARTKPLSSTGGGSGLVGSTNTPTANEVGEGGGFTSPNNAHTSDNVYAQANTTTGQRVGTLWKTFGFDGVIAAGRIIWSVRVRVEYKISDFSAPPAPTLEVQAVVNGVNQTPVRTDVSNPPADTFVEFDLTGVRPWTRADVLDAALKIRVTAIGGAGNGGTFDVDEVAVTVQHSPTTAVMRTARLIPFEFSTTQAYALEFGHLYVRPFANSGIVELLAGTGVSVETVTSYTETDLAELAFAQSADILYLAHSLYAPRKLKRVSATSFTFTEIAFVDGPYRDVQTTPTITPSATTGNGITLTASAALFNANHVGALWRIRHGVTTGYVKIVGFTSSTVVTADVKKTLGGTTASDDHREGAWSTHRGFPRAVTFFEDRLYFAGPKDQPQRFDGSGIGTYEDFTPGTADDDAVSFSVTSGKVNVIRWLLGARDLLIGTVGEEFSEKGASGKTITPTSIQSESETTHGSAAIAPVRIGNSVLFVQRAGKKLRELLFNFDIDGYLSVDATLLAQHLTKTSAILELAYQQEPNSILWAIRADGQLLALVYDKTQDVAGWARHVTDGKFKSIAAIPHPNGDRDQLWAIVERTINGATWRYVEYLDDTGGSFAAYEQLGVDSGLTYSGAATATLSGLAHLEGETVDIVGNGFVYPQKVVSGGQVTGLDPTVTSAEVGLPFTSKLETLPPVPQAAPDAPKRRARLFVQLHDSLGLKINGQQLDFRKASDPMDLPVPIFTGAKEVVSLGWDKEGIVKIEQAQPLPCTVLSVHGHFDAGD